jgi:anti-sigma factor RsiW
MNCKAMEALIALYIEGDLGASDFSRVVSHLDGCAACRYFADDMRESQSMFKSLRAGTVNSADLAGVRQRVLNEVGELDPAPGWLVAMHRLFFAGMRRRNAIAGVVLAALLSGSVWFSQWHLVGVRKDVSPVEVARLEVPPSALVSDVVNPPADVTPVVRRVPPVQAFEAMPADEPEVQLIDEPVPPESQVLQIPMKFVTDDPDIIIYWLPSDKGD